LAFLCCFTISLADFLNDYLVARAMSV